MVVPLCVWQACGGAARSKHMARSLAACQRSHVGDAAAEEGGDGGDGDGGGACIFFCFAALCLALRGAVRDAKRSPAARLRRARGSAMLDRLQSRRHAGRTPVEPGHDAIAAPAAGPARAASVAASGCHGPPLASPQRLAASACRAGLLFLPTTLGDARRCKVCATYRAALCTPRSGDPCARPWAGPARRERQAWHGRAANSIGARSGRRVWAAWTTGWVGERRRILLL